MTIIQVWKLALLIGIGQCTLIAQEKQTLTAPDALAKKFEAKFQETTKVKLLTFAQSVGKNPEIFLDNVPTFYSNTCQAAENRTCGAYMSSSLLNLKKSLAYICLSRSVNLQVYSCYVEEVLGRMNRPIDSTLETSSETKQMHDIQLQCLATITDHPALKQKAARLFAQEWALKSVQMDFTALAESFRGLESAFKNERQKLSLSEQNDNSLDTFNTKLTKTINTLNRAAEIITHKKTVKQIIKNPFGYIFDCIKDNSLEKELEEMQKLLLIDTINELCKAQNLGNGLLHLICSSVELTSEQKQQAISILKKKHEMLINESNDFGKTPLDVNVTPSIKDFLIGLGAKNALLHYDTPPASPANGNNVPKKNKSLRVSFQQD